MEFALSGGLEPKAADPSVSFTLRSRLSFNLDEGSARGVVLLLTFSLSALAALLLALAAWWACLRPAAPAKTQTGLPGEEEEEAAIAEVVRGVCDSYLREAKADLETRVVSRLVALLARPHFKGRCNSPCCRRHSGGRVGKRIRKMLSRDGMKDVIVKQIRKREQH